MKTSFLIYFPNLNIDNNEILSFKNNFSLHNIQEFKDYQSFFRENLYNIKQGCLLKHKESFLFKEVDYENIYHFVNKLIFCFFINFHGFNKSNQQICKESFNFYIFQEINPDPSFEYKITIMNGISFFSESRDEYIINSNKIIKKLKINEFMFKDLNNELFDNFKNEIRLFNQIFTHRNPLDLNINSLIIKSTIEKSLKNSNKNIEITKQNIHKIFIHQVIDYIKKSESLINKNLYDLFLIIKNNENHLIEYINKILKNLKESRDNIAHDGKTDHPYSNITFFVYWFELFLEIISYSKPKKEYAIKMIAFLWIIHFDLNKWFYTDYRNLHVKKNLIETHYDFIVFSNRLPIISTLILTKSLIEDQYSIYLSTKKFNEEGFDNLKVLLKELEKYSEDEYNKKVQGKNINSD